MTYKLRLRLCLHEVSAVRFHLNRIHSRLVHLDCVGRTRAQYHVVPNWITFTGKHIPMVEVVDLSFPIWKPAHSIDDPSRVRIQEPNANLVDRMQLAKLPLNAASQVTSSVLSN